MAETPRRRRSLSHIGGTTETAGDRVEAGWLARALAVDPATDADDDPAREHIHGFHSYPARMHPQTAARLVRAITPKGGRVLDPFCGSGTVLVEALIAGYTACGVDLNPLAVKLSRCKTRPRPALELEQLLECARDCAAKADARRKAKAGATRRLAPEDVAAFEPHVLMELDSLREAIRAVQSDSAREDLWLVLSSLLVKLSQRRGDTSTAAAPRRTAAGSAAKLFVRKTEELVERLAHFNRLLPTTTTPTPITEGNATDLRWLVPGSVDAVVTSPPYAATYDYVAHHELRLRWLGLSETSLRRGELGSRSAYQRLNATQARAEWSKELTAFLLALARILPRDGPIALLMADSAVGAVALRADEVVALVARECGFVPIACASQSRPHFHMPTATAFRTRPRAEHAILLRKR